MGRLRDLQMLFLLFTDVGEPERIKRISATRFFRRHATGIAPVELHTVRVDRGMSWDEALEM